MVVMSIELNSRTKYRNHCMAAMSLLNCKATQRSGVPMKQMNPAACLSLELPVLLNHDRDRATEIEP